MTFIFVTSQYLSDKFLALAGFSSSRFVTELFPRRVTSAWPYTNNNPDLSIFQILEGSFSAKIERKALLSDAYQVGSKRGSRL